MPPQNLGRVDKYNRSFMDVVYTPVSNLTQQIMNTTAFAPVMKGRCANSQKVLPILLVYFLVEVQLTYSVVNLCCTAH